MTNTVTLSYISMTCQCFEWSSSVIQADHGMTASISCNSSHYQLSKTLMFIILSLALVCRTDTHTHPSSILQPQLLLMQAHVCLVACPWRFIYLSSLLLLNLVQTLYSICITSVWNYGTVAYKF